MSRKVNSSKQENTADNHGIEMNGTIVEALRNAMFRVHLETGHTVLCHVCGKIRKFFVRVIPGDKVIVELSPYDLTRGRIIRRI